MTPEKIHAILQQHLDNANIQVQGDGHHFEAKITSSAFAGLNRVKRQQLIYQILNPWISSGELHAISLKTLTPEEQASL